MEIYFVRHGETASNVARRHQPSHTRLTPRGRAQARAVAKDIAALQPTHFFSSSQVRALETAEIIGETIEMIPQVDSVFVELNRPKNMYGWHHRDPRSLWYLARWFFGFAGAKDDAEAGENYQSLRRRVKAAQALLSALPQDARVVVVTHSVFITMFRAHMCNERPLSVWQAVQFLRKVFATKNTDIIHVRYIDVGEAHVCAWQEVVE